MYARVRYTVLKEIILGRPRKKAGKEELKNWKDLKISGMQWKERRLRTGRNAVCCDRNFRIWFSNSCYYMAELVRAEKELSD